MAARPVQTDGSKEAYDTYVYAAPPDTSVTVNQHGCGSVKPAYAAVGIVPQLEPCECIATHDNPVESD